MTKRLLYLALFAVTFTPLLRASPPIGAEVQTWHYDTATKMLSFRVVNTSQKDITGYKVSVETSSGSGAKEQFTVAWDLMGPILRNEQDAAFRPGGYQDRTIAAPANVADLHLILVLYGDETVEADDNKSLTEFVAWRTNTMAAMKQVAAVVQKAIDNSADSNPSETALKEVRALAAKSFSSAEGLVFQEGHSKFETSPHVRSDGESPP